MEHLALIFGIIGNAASLMVFLSPLPTFWRIIRKRTTEDFCVVPYVACFFSQVLWVYYGVLDPKGLLILTISAIGAVLEILYVTVYMALASKQQLRFTVRLLSLGSFTFAILLIGTQLGTSGKTRLYIVGFLSVVNAICMFAAPLSVTRLVIRTKSVEYMPLFLSLSLFICGGVWMSYAMIQRDIFVLVPTGIGFLLGTLELILYSIYYKRTPNQYLPEAAKSVDIERRPGESDPLRVQDMEEKRRRDQAG